MRIFQRIAAWFKAVWRLIMALPKGITNAVPVSGDAEITGAKTFTQGPYGTTVAMAAADVDLSAGDVFTGYYLRRYNADVLQRPGRQGGDLQPHYHQRRSRHGHVADFGQVGLRNGSYAYGVRSGCPDVPYPGRRRDLVRHRSHYSGSLEEGRGRCLDNA